MPGKTCATTGTCKPRWNHAPVNVGATGALAGEAVGAKVGAAELLHAHNTLVVQAIARAMSEIATSRNAALRELADSLA